jgi:hypothetical protein
MLKPLSVSLSLSQATLHEPKNLLQNIEEFFKINRVETS